MTTKNYQSNIFLVSNLQDLSCEYRLYEIQGLSNRNRDFQKNRQNLINKLSRKLKHPITIIEKDEKQFLVTKNDPEIRAKLPVEYPIVRGRKVFFDDTKEVFPLSFNSTKPSERAICERFLNFETQGTLYKNNRLWQPTPGQPFFLKRTKRINGVDIFTGYRVRAVDLGVKWGIMVDVTKKIVNSTPLPPRITAEEFYAYYKGKHFLYRFGDNWYVVKLTEFEDLKANQYSYLNDAGDEVVLIDEVRKATFAPHSKDLANLPEDGSVLRYYTASDETRAVVAGLCYEVIGNEDEEGGQTHKESILPPYNREGEINWFREEFLRYLMFGAQKIVLQPNLHKVECGSLSFPDLTIGNDMDFYASNFDCPFQYAKARMDMLTSRNCGFYKSDEPLFSPQYIFLPRSVHDTMGSEFCERLKAKVNSMYPWDKFSPEVCFYEDKFSGSNNYVKLGKRIVEAVCSVSSKGISPHALVMIPDFRKGNREHDELAALIIQELEENKKIRCSFIHTNTIMECYYEGVDELGKVVYLQKPEKKGKMNGYLTHVSLKQVLLSNNKRPYVLKTPLYADLTIGIDVKEYVAGFAFFDKFAKNVRREFKGSSKKERIDKELMVKILYEVIEAEVKMMDKLPENIIFHRDGRFFDTEIEGIEEAFQLLKNKDILPLYAQFSLLELPKKVQVSLRLFDNFIDRRSGKRFTENPEVGAYWIANQGLAFICTTGKEFRHDGTTNPLCVRMVKGSLSFNDGLQDIFYLSSLAYTKPNECSRIPMTIKLLDIYLKDRVSKYDKKEYANQLETDEDEYYN
ncbi:MAG: hypothetical protein HY842_07220 [Bacteroidetes bacterium]|nr:hypothetical protein [Bacteroidota bacterium]